MRAYLNKYISIIVGCVWIVNVNASYIKIAIPSNMETQKLFKVKVNVSIVNSSKIINYEMTTKQKNSNQSLDQLCELLLALNQKDHMITAIFISLLDTDNHFVTGYVQAIDLPVSVFIDKNPMIYVKDNDPYEPFISFTYQAQKFYDSR